MATREFLTSVHDAWGFLRAYILVIRARRLLERRGLKGAQRSMLRPWKTNSINITPDDRLITWVDKAVLAACRWQTRETTCFPRAVAAYSLLRSAGARPVIHIGIKARPFAHELTMGSEQDRRNRDKDSSKPLAATAMMERCTRIPMSGKSTFFESTFP
jgi:hypothetical protein